jgi:hypothetical protein
VDGLEGLERLKSRHGYAGAIEFVLERAVDKKGDISRIDSRCGASRSLRRDWPRLVAWSCHLRAPLRPIASRCQTWASRPRASHLRGRGRAASRASGSRARTLCHAAPTNTTSGGDERRRASSTLTGHPFNLPTIIEQSEQPRRSIKATYRNLNRHVACTRQARCSVVRTMIRSRTEQMK